jgi:hypothetical protein
VSFFVVISRAGSTLRCFLSSKSKDDAREIRLSVMPRDKQGALPSSRLEENIDKQNLTVAKIESKSTRGLAVNARRSCVDIDAAS